MLPTLYPDASAETDDPDEDGMTNYAEMLAGTEPTDKSSLLTLERVPRPNDLTAEDQTAIGPTRHALYFQSVPGKQYGIQWAESLTGPWNTSAGVICERSGGLRSMKFSSSANPHAVVWYRAQSVRVSGAGKRRGRPAHWW